ncbi:MAG: NAD-dependent succinate-semialdehyde dehydrogenase [Thermoanaerobaculia bacterium]|nr:NAD-dependent succinate-semialdehyde dehydrogenase [Thermoanaerobaculia bacterium]
MQSINPATGEVIREYEEHRAHEAASAVRRAAEAFADWRERPLAERCEIVGRAAEVLRDGLEEYARLMTDEMGKPIGEARSEIDKCAWVCEFYADSGAEMLRPQPVETDAARSLVRFDPIGPVFGIMPWNFPFWQVFRYSAPTLVAGNVALLKHASNVPGCALAIESVWRDAGLPEGGFTTLLVGGAQASDLIGHPDIAAVTLTGSDAAGREVAAEAGRHLRKSVLELGGSDPFIVLDDADPAEVARQAVKARTINSGQSCIAAKRFIVDESLADRFEVEMVEAIGELAVGDPSDEETDIGPLAREDLLEELHDQVERAVEAGALLLTGGERLDRPGYFYAPTVLGSVAPGNPAFEEETFGPVAPLVRARGEEEAIELANRSRFGLGASLWSGDRERAERLVERIDAGSVFVNGIVKSDPRLPFGGVKASGYGRELSAYGLREFVNIKTVWVG